MSLMSALVPAMSSSVVVSTGGGRGHGGMVVVAVVHGAVVHVVRGCK